MVELTFKGRAENFVPLSLIKRIASSTSEEPDEDITNIGKEGVKAIKGMLAWILELNSVTNLFRHGACQSWSAERSARRRGGMDCSEATFSDAKDSGTAIGQGPEGAFKG